MPRRADRPDIEVGAVVKARKLRFRRVPKRRTRQIGDWRSETQRTNLPPDVEAGVEYRDAEIRAHSEARVAARLAPELEGGDR